MYQIVIEAKPNKTSKDFGKYEGAMVVLFIDYKDIDGAFQLARYYVEDNDWTVIEVDEIYYSIDSKEEMDENYQQYFDEIKEYGHSIIYNAYEANK